MKITVFNAPTRNINCALMAYHAAISCQSKGKRTVCINLDKNVNLASWFKIRGLTSIIPATLEHLGSLDNVNQFQNSFDHAHKDMQPEHTIIYASHLLSTIQLYCSILADQIVTCLSPVDLLSSTMINSHGAAPHFTTSILECRNQHQRLTTRTVPWTILADDTKLSASDNEHLSTWCWQNSFQYLKFSGFPPGYETHVASTGTTLFDKAQKGGETVAKRWELKRTLIRLGL